MSTIDVTQLSAEQRADLLKQMQTLENQERQQKQQAYEELKADAVVSLIQIAQDLNQRLSDFKKHSFETMESLYEILKEYSERHADGKGNFKVEFQHFKIEFSKQERGSYDERASQAEAYIFDFIKSRYAEDEATKEFILSLLERKKGDLDPDNIQKLYTYEQKFNDENFSRACALFRESFKKDYSKDYIRFYERDEQGKWKQIILQFSAV